jgi:anaerobic magnesium-protoporphyrin IX monomethyl ester cyclase
VLFNPWAEHFTMPLALIAIGSAVDPARYDVRIVDARLERRPVDAVLSLLDGAVCVGITVLSGSPIRGALEVTRAVKARRPDLPIVWGGWHPSLFSAACIDEEPGVTATVQGQGEITFREILERLPDPPRDVPGSTCRVGEHALVSAPRPLASLDSLPSHDYTLAPIERYFALKQRRQLDYISSQGCLFRCAFCSDPTVYQRKWVGLDPVRIGDELERLWRTYGFDDVNFQDETFFTSPGRVQAIAEDLLRRGIRTSWAATLRADQGVRLPDDVWDLCRRSGLRRVLVGVESGSPLLLKWMKKDITLDQVFETAEKCRRHGIAAHFPFIVGFPDEPPESVTETLQVVGRLRAMSPDFETPIFFYLPYPGSPITEEVARAGHRLPQTLEEWAELDFMTSRCRWVSDAKRKRVEAFRFYQRYAWSHPSAMRRPIQRLAQWRCHQILARA